MTKSFPTSSGDCCKVRSERRMCNENSTAGKLNLHPHEISVSTRNSISCWRILLDSVRTKLIRSSLTRCSQFHCRSTEKFKKPNFRGGGAQNSNRHRILLHQPTNLRQQFVWWPMTSEGLMSRRYRPSSHTRIQSQWSRTCVRAKKYKTKERDCDRRTDFQIARGALSGLAEKQWYVPQAFLLELPPDRTERLLPFGSHSTLSYESWRSLTPHSKSQRIASVDERYSHIRAWKHSWHNWIWVHVERHYEFPLFITWGGGGVLTPLRLPKINCDMIQCKIWQTDHYLFIPLDETTVLTVKLYF